MHHKVFGLMYSEINIRFFINEATYGTNHSRMDEVKFVYFEYFVPDVKFLLSEDLSFFLVTTFFVDETFVLVSKKLNNFDAPQCLKTTFERNKRIGKVSSNHTK